MMWWWNRMRRRGNMIEGLDCTPENAIGGYTCGAAYVAERVHMPGDILFTTFKVTSITYPKSERPPKGPRS